MQMINRKKPRFQDLYDTGVLSRLVAVRVDSGRWSLFGVWGDKDIAVFVEAARGGTREWSSLDHLAEFCNSMGIEIYEVHQKKGGKRV